MNWADWTFTFGAYASASSVRMVRLVEYAQAELESLSAPIDAVEKQVIAKMYYVLVMLVKDSAIQKAPNALVGRGSESWILLCEECDLRRCQVLLSAIMRVHLREHLGESLDNLERQVEGRPKWHGDAPDEVVAATVIAASDDSTVAQHVALTDATLDTYHQIADAVRLLV